jgi:hypothetical protein
VQQIKGKPEVEYDLEGRLSPLWVRPSLPVYSCTIDSEEREDKLVMAKLPKRSNIAYEYEEGHKCGRSTVTATDITAVFNASSPRDSFV